MCVQSIFYRRHTPGIEKTSLLKMFLQATKTVRDTLLVAHVQDVSTRKCHFKTLVS